MGAAAGGPVREGVGGVGVEGGVHVHIQPTSHLSLQACPLHLVGGPALIPCSRPACLRTPPAPHLTLTRARLPLA